MAKRNVSVAAIEHAESLQRLVIDQPVRDLQVIRGLKQLTEVDLPATSSTLENLAGHPSLRRLTLNHGTYRDLSALESCPHLTDIELWQIKQLTADDLKPIAKVKHLDALALGALRNVTTLDWLSDGPCRVRFLSLEKLPALESYEPLRECSEVLAFGAWDSRPADQRLDALHHLPLRDLVLGDAYPAAEIQALLEHCQARVRIRSQVRDNEPPRLGWRALFAYADEYRKP
jgi:hypothetical protein